MKKTALALALVCGGGVAAAADNGFYVGIGAGQSNFDLPGAADEKDNGYKGLIGFRILDSFGVEASYADHGKSAVPSGIACTAIIGVNCPTTLNVGAKTASAFAVVFADFPVLDLFAKVGVSNWQVDGSIPGASALNFKQDGTDLAWGAGLQAHFGSLGARAEYEQVKYFGERKLGTISVSFVYTIL